MKPLQFLLFYAWGCIGFAALLGVPPGALVGPAALGALASGIGLALELLGA